MQFIDNPGDNPVGDRLERLGYGPPSRRKPLVELDARAKLLIEYQVTGCPHSYVTQLTRLAPTGEDPDRRVPIDPGWPLTLDEAADLLRIRRRRARWIMSQPVAQRELAAQLQALRSGAKAGAVRTAIEIMGDKGLGLAADRKVRLDAAKLVLGDEANRAPSVNVNVNNGVQLAAGVVIRLPPGIAAPPLEEQQAAPQRSPYPLRQDPETLRQACLPRANGDSEGA